MIEAFEKWFFSDVCKHHSYEHELLVWQAGQEQQIKRDAELCKEQMEFIDKTAKTMGKGNMDVLIGGYNAVQTCRNLILNQEPDKEPTPAEIEYKRRRDETG